MKLKVEILECDNRYDLEKSINNMLKQYDVEDIVDIKYSGNGGTSPYGIKNIQP